MRMVLDELGVAYRERHGWQSIKCISPDHHDRHASASLNIEAGRFKCHACGLSGDGYDMADALLGMKAVDMEGEDMQPIPEDPWF